jgi:hypothetical protein
MLIYPSIYFLEETISNRDAKCIPFNSCVYVFLYTEILKTGNMNNQFRLTLIFLEIV